MAIIHAISFDDATADSGGYALYGFSDITTYGNLPRKAGRYGGYAMGVEDIGTIDRSVRLNCRSESLEWTVGFDFYWVTQTETDPRGFFDLLDYNGARMFRVALAADGTLKFYRGNGATLLGTTSTATVTSTWYHIEFQLRMNDTTGLLIVKVDGVEEINISATDTLEAGVVTPSYWLWGSFGSGSSHREKRMDNLIVQDSLNWMGEVYAEPLTLSADTADKDWLRSTGSDNYALIDETVFSDTDYLESGTVGDLDLYTLSNLTSDPSSIKFVQTLAALRMNEAGTRVLRAALKSSATVGYGSQRGITDTGANRYYVDRFLTDPNGGVAWTKTAVDALTAGVEVYA
jgi:hypothetical protein